MNEGFIGFTDEEIEEASRDMAMIRREALLSLEENYPFYITIIEQIRWWNKNVVDCFNGLSAERIIYLLDTVLSYYNARDTRYTRDDPRDRQEIREMVQELWEWLEPHAYETVVSVKALAMGVLALYARPNH